MERLVRGLEALRVWREAFEKLGRADGNDERYDIFGNFSFAFFSARNGREPDGCNSSIP